MKQIFIMGLLSLSMQAGAQSFERTMSDANVDFNHYSVENSISGDYILAGTKFDNPSANNDIHVFRLDANGNILWEALIDASPDDRAVDITEDDQKNILVCGYVEITGPSGPVHQAYVVKLDPAGNFMADALIRTEGDHSAATNIIYSPTNNAYIVGGMVANNFSHPLTGNSAFIAQVPYNLSTGTSWLTVFTGPTQTNASVNDIVEVPSQGFFITGGVNFGASYMQGVLAHFVDFFGIPQQNLSFNSSNDRHLGISAAYVPADDRIYLMSNNTVVHNPQITIIENIASSPFIGSSYYLELDPSYGQMNAAGFELRHSLLNPNNLVAAGYFQFYPVIYTPNTVPWLAEFDKNTGANVSTMVFDVPALNFYTHGGGLFSTFLGQQPRIFNQEILAYRPDGGGYFFVGPRTVGANYGLDLVSTTLNPQGIDCMKEYKYTEIPINHTPITPIWSRSGLSISNPSFPVNPVNTPVKKYCNVFFKPAPATDHGALSEIKNEDTRVTAYPNPASDILHVDLNLPNTEQVTLSFYDLQGREVMIQNKSVNEGNTSLQIDISKLKAGLYLMKVTDVEGHIYPGVQIHKM